MISDILDSVVICRLSVTFEDNAILSRNLICLWSSRCILQPMIVRGWHCGSVRVLALSGHGLNPPFGTLSVCSLRDGRRLSPHRDIITDIRCLVPREFSIKFRAGGKFR